MIHFHEMRNNPVGIPGNDNGDNHQYPDHGFFHGPSTPELERWRSNAEKHPIARQCAKTRSAAKRAPAAFQCESESKLSGKRSVCWKSGNNATSGYPNDGSMASK